MYGRNLMASYTGFTSFLNSKLLTSVLAILSINGFVIFVNKLLQTEIILLKNQKNMEK
jgi:hypothetical protein